MWGISGCVVFDVFPYSLESKGLSFDRFKALGSIEFNLGIGIQVLSCLI